MDAICNFPKLGRLLFLACCVMGLTVYSAWTSLLNTRSQPSAPTSVIHSRIISNRTAARAKFSDLEFVRIVGVGTVSYGFEAKLNNKTVMAKITGDRHLHYSDVEIHAFEVLNEAPTIVNIPKLELAIPRLANPFKSKTFLQNLGVRSGDAKWLIRKEEISVQVMPYLPHSRRPKTIDDFRIFTKSLLQGLQHAHSRNVMLCDLHSSNYHFDGTTVSLYDWNAAFFFEPNKIKLHYTSEPRFLMPPEAWNNESAVHATVSGFDIYSVGLLIKELWSKCCSEQVPDVQLLDLVNQTMIADPYRRPDSTALLQHEFLADMQQEQQ